MAAANVAGNEVIMIRAQGKDSSGMTHYTAAEEGGQKRNLFSIQVNEGADFANIYAQTTTEQFSPLRLVYRAVRGFKSSIANMVVRSATDPVIGTINHRKIVTVNNHVMAFDYCWIAAEKEHEIKLRSNPQSQVEVGATIRARKQCSSVSVTFYKNLQGAEKFIVIMAAVKHFYCFYKLHLHPIPAEIPALMAEGAYVPPSLIHSATTTQLRLRMSCQTAINGIKFMEVLHAQTNQVVMVVGSPGPGLANTNVFQNPFGLELFRANELDPQSGNIDIEIFVGPVQIGSMKDDILLAAGNSMIAKPSTDLPIISQIYNQMRLLPIARISEGQDRGSVIVRFIEAEDLGYRVWAVILAYATSIAMHHYKLLDCYLPTYRSYPYRKA